MKQCKTAELYLDLLKRILANLIYQDPPIPIFPGPSDRFDLEVRLSGSDKPSQAHTMIGVRRLENIQELAEDVLRKEVPGDFIEAGVARGGATIFMRGVLKAYGIHDRAVWVADSFGRFPRSAESGITQRSYTSPYWHQMAGLSRKHPDTLSKMMERVNAGTSYDEVRDHFARYGLLDDQVRFLRGWFHDTLPSAQIEELALLRIDADLYDSTYEALRCLYPKLSEGGYVIVDDYHTFPECRQAVHDYLEAAGAEPELRHADDAAVFWRKTALGSA